MINILKFLTNKFTTLIYWLLSWWFTFKNDMSDLDEECILHDAGIWSATCDKVSEYTVPLAWEGILLSARIAACQRMSDNANEQIYNSLNAEYPELYTS